MVRKLLAHIKGDSLYLNSIYLLLNTMLMAGMGFIFWLLCARLFDSEQIGVATTLISAMTLVSYTSLLGFNNTFIRYLPTSKRRNEQISTGLILTLIAAIFIASAYVLLVPYIAPKLGIVHQPIYGIGFVLLAACAAGNLLTDSIFIAYRAARFNLLVNGLIMSCTKVLLPLVFVSFGAYGIFLASGSAAAAALLASLYFLIKKFGFKPSHKVDKTELQQVFRYSFSNYIANLLNIAPTLILPTIIINELGASSAAYYYLAFMIANLLYTVAYSLTQSLFAEGSYEERTHSELIKKAGGALAALTIIGSVVLAVSASLLLNVFGNDYSLQAAPVLRVLALAAPAVALYVMVNVLLRLHKQTRAIIIVDAIYLLVVCGLAIIWAPRGLTWIGAAWLLGNLTSGLVGLILLTRKQR